MSLSSLMHSVMNAMLTKRMTNQSRGSMGPRYSSHSNMHPIAPPLHSLMDRWSMMQLNSP